MTSKQRITVKKTGIKPGLYAKIRTHALGSFYRINSGNANLYTFSIDDDGLDWSGGWAWLDHPGTWDGYLAISLVDGKLYQLSIEA